MTSFKSKRRMYSVVTSNSLVNNRQTSSSLCPWWNVNSKLFEKKKKKKKKCNVYGLYQYVVASHDENNCIDLSFWPLNDDDIELLMVKLGTEPSMKESSTNNNQHILTSISEINSICGIQDIKLHSCEYLSDIGVRHLATKWNQRCSGDSTCDHNDSKKGIKHLGITKRELKSLNDPLLSLDLSNCVKISNASCAVIGAHFNELRVLNLSHCINITDDGLHYIMQGCKYLNEIHLKNLIRLQDEGLGYLRQNLVLMKLLKVIDIAGCTGITNEAVMFLLESDPSPGIINQIDVSGCTQLELGFIGLSRRVIPNNLKSIRMKYYPTVSDSMMGWIASGCKNLQKIDLTGCSFVHEFTLEYLFSGCKRLMSLCLNRCISLTDDAFTGFNSEAGKCLLEIELIDCDKLHHSITYIVQYCPNLLKLNLRGVSQVCDETLKVLANSCHFLEYLDLSAQSIKTRTSTNSYTSRIGSEGMKALGNKCHNLRVLRCNGCIHLDDECISTIAIGCPLLEEIGLKNCFRITDQTLRAIGKHCKAMRRLVLSSCKEISDDGIRSLSCGCNQLEEVDLVGVFQITDNSIVSMAIHCNRLKRVNLRHCYKLSDKSLIALSELCPCLEDIDMFAVDCLSDNSVSSINFNCTLFRSLNVGNTEITETALTKLNENLYCSIKKANTVALVPLHSKHSIHLQHSKYLNFLLQHQKVLYCGVKRYLLTKRLKQRRYLSMQCKKIQCLFRNHRNLKLLSTVAEAKAKESESILFHKKCAHIISSFFQRLYHRQKYLATLHASIVIQRSARNLISKKKKMKLPEQPTSPLETQIMAIVDVSTETAKKTEDDEDASFTSEANEVFVMKWVAIVSKCLQLQQKQLINSSAQLIQKQWRERTTKVQLEQKKYIKRKCKIWLITFAREQRNMRMMKVWAAFVIQKYCTNVLQWKMKMQQIMQEEQQEQEIIVAYKKIGNFITSRLCVMNAKLILKSLKQHRLKDLKSSLLLQCWWRKMICIAKFRHKQGIIRRWMTLVETNCSSKRHKAATIIQSRFRLKKRQKERTRAAIVIAYQITILIKKKNQRNAILLNKKIAAATLVACQVRGMLVRKDIEKKKAATTHIQRFWKMFRCRQYFRQQYIQEQQRIRCMVIKEKKYLKEQQRLKLIHLQFEKTEDRAARIIQTRFRYFISVIQRENEIREVEQEEIRKRDIEKERRREYITFKKRKRYIRPAAAKECINNVLSVVSNIKPKQMIGGVKKIMTNYIKDKTEKENLYKELVNYSHLKNRGITTKSVSVKLFHKSIHSALSSYDWFDKRCEKFMISYVIFPDELLQLRRIWKCHLDFRNEEEISIYDFFDHVQEKKSDYGIWLFHSLSVSTDEQITFSEYIHVVIYFSLLGKLDILKTVFKIQCRSNIKLLEKQDWVSLVEMMLANEEVQYSWKAAIQAFDKYASSDLHGNKILVFDDFQEIVNQFPFIVMPILRLQTKVRRHHLGEKFWKNKALHLHNANASIKK